MRRVGQSLPGKDENGALTDASLAQDLYRQQQGLAINAAIAGMPYPEFKRRYNATVAGIQDNAPKGQEPTPEGERPSLGDAFKNQQDAQDVGSFRQLDMEKTYQTGIGGFGTTNRPEDLPSMFDRNNRLFNAVYDRTTGRARKHMAALGGIAQAGNVDPQTIEVEGTEKDLGDIVVGATQGTGRQRERSQRILKEIAKGDQKLMFNGQKISALELSKRLDPKTGDLKGDPETGELVKRDGGEQKSNVKVDAKFDLSDAAKKFFKIEDVTSEQDLAGRVSKAQEWFDQNIGKRLNEGRILGK